jgi:hypothetical protein
MVNEWRKCTIVIDQVSIYVQCDCASVHDKILPKYIIMGEVLLFTCIVLLDIKNKWPTHRYNADNLGVKFYNYENL